MKLNGSDAVESKKEGKPVIDTFVEMLQAINPREITSMKTCEPGDTPVGDASDAYLRLYGLSQQMALCTNNPLSNALCSAAKVLAYAQAAGDHGLSGAAFYLDDKGRICVKNGKSVIHHGTIRRSSPAVVRGG